MVDDLARLAGLDRPGGTPPIEGSSAHAVIVSWVRTQDRVKMAAALGSLLRDHDASDSHIAFILTLLAAIGYTARRRTRDGLPSWQVTPTASAADEFRARQQAAARAAAAEDAGARAGGGKLSNLAG